MEGTWDVLNLTHQGSLYELNSLSQVIEDKLRKLAAEQTLVVTKQGKVRSTP